MGCIRGERKNPTETENDVENQEKQEGEEGPMKEVKAKAEAQKFCTLRVKLLILLVTLSAFAGTTTAILWPRDVTWQLTNLDVKDESSLMFFVMAFGKGMTNDTKLPDLVFLAGANLENPNFLGGTAMSGEFQVLYDDQVLGGGRSEPVQVPALGTGMVQAEVRVKLNHSLLQQITADVLEHSLRAIIKVKGGATVKSIFGLQLHCRMDCDIQALVSEIFGQTKQAVVENKNCSYTYF